MVEDIAKLEQKLLSNSTVNDICLSENRQQNPDLLLSAKQIKHDVSVIARTLINGYCGWPFHNKIVKHQILIGLTEVYDTAHNMSAKEFFNLLKPIFAKIPDNHIQAVLMEDVAKTELSHINKNVGKNIATRAEQLKFERRKGVAIIAASTLSGFGGKQFEQIKEFVNTLNSSNCLIVDLRGNGGGNSGPMDKLADFLYGAKTRSVVKSWIRTTPEAAIIQSSNQNNSWSSLDKSKDPAIWQSYDTQYPKFASENQGYTKPIYILTDGNTGSSAEMFVLRMTKHPNVKYVGDNTAGMEVYGFMRETVVPNSGVKLRIGNVYRELEQKNFELIGHAPDIACRDGQDALETAISDFDKSKICDLVLMNSDIYRARK